MTVTDFFAGEIVTGLLKELMAVSRKSIMFKSAAESLHASITQLLPTIQEIKLSGVELPAFRQFQLDRFSEFLRDGLDLATTALRSKRWNVYKNFTLARKMEKLEREIKQFLHGPLQLHVLADVHNFRFNADERFDRIERNTERIAESIGAMRIGGGGGNWTVMGEQMRMASESSDMEVAASVGMEFGKRKVKEMLIGREDWSVVGVCGTGGSGKTTLVNELCKDNEVFSYFDGRILFLTVSQSPDLENMRNKIWGFVMGNSNLHPGYVIPQYNLNHPIKPSVRTLIVLDDAWSLAHLETLVVRYPGCKTLVVSRTKFTTIVKDPKEAIHEMALLGEEEALTLFCLSAFGQKSIPQTADANLIKQIVSECKGLPLALKVIGASLRDEPEISWKSARNRLARGETIGELHETHLLERMAISVNCLSEEVKECFLDLGAFPEDKKIPLDVLINVWAELHHIDPEEAFAILAELANKNLITLVKDSRYGDAYCSCYDIAVTQHDVLRDLALHLSRRGSVNERARLLMPKRESELPKKWDSDRPFNARIVSIHIGEMNEMDWFPMDFPKAEVLILNISSENFFLPPFINNMPKLRALVIINDHSASATLRNVLEFSSLAKLRSLWLEKVVVPQLSAAVVPLTELRKLTLVLCQVENSFDHYLKDLAPTLPSLLELTIDHCDDLFELPPSLCGLHYLKTLGITNCHGFQKLPSDLGRVKSLEILRLCACPELKELPSSLIDLPCLKYLDISQCVNMSSLPRGIDRLKSLDKIDMRNCSRLTSLPKLTNPLWGLRYVICDDEVSWQWQDAKNSLPHLNVEVAEKHYSLDWLDE